MIWTLGVLQVLAAGVVLGVIAFCLSVWLI